MNFYAASALINFLTTLFLGIVVVARNPRSKLNLTFFIFSLDVSLWSLCYYLWQISPSPEQALFWSKTFMAFAIFIPVLYLHFVFSLTKIEKNKRLLLGITYFIFILFLLIDILSPSFITSVKSIQQFKFWPVAGPLYIPFLAFWLGYMLYNAYYLYSIQRTSKGLLKLQIKYVFLGFVVGFVGGITNYFMWFGIPIPPFGNILVSVYVALNAYAIIKHRFFDIRLIVARAVAYSVVVTLIGIFYVGATFILSSVLLGSTNSRNQLLLYTILTIIVAFSFERLRHIVENLTDKIFFKGRYDSNQLLSRLGFIMSTTLELGSLTSQIIQELIKQTRISKGAFVILGEGQNSIYEVIDIGFTNKLTVSYNQISPFLSYPKTIVFDELEENQLKKLMRELDISVAKPLWVKGGAVGMLLLGEKASGEIYSEQDLKVLEILAPEIAIAIQNSQSYDKIKKFNVILSDEVRKATAELQGANQRLRELDQLKDEFVSVASHELRTPMTVIRSYAWMVLHRSGIPLPQNVQKYAARILISTERLINLVNEMLNISRIESGRIEINPEPVDLISLCKDIIDEVYSSKSTAKEIQFSLLKQALPKVFVDPEKLRQVFLNIIGNALKFSPAGSKITIGFFADGSLMGTYIKDEGPGIGKEDMPKLFTKFGRLDSSYTAAAVSGGTGLGLFISKSLVELMHGRIWAQSEGMGKGTIFAVSVPVATEETLKNADEYKVKAKSGTKGLEPVAV